LPTVHVTSPQTPEEVIRSIMALCPGGPVGAVMATQGKLLLPRRMTIERVIIERRGRGLPMGRIVVGIANRAPGTALTIEAGPHPGALIVSAVLIVALASGAAIVAGTTAAIVVGAALTMVEAVRWSRALPAIAADGERLANQLRSDAVM
jgi:hypothetical protein